MVTEIRAIQGEHTSVASARDHSKYPLGKRELKRGILANPMRGIIGGGEGGNQTHGVGGRIRDLPIISLLLEIRRRGGVEPEGETPMGVG